MIFFTKQQQLLYYSHFTMHMHVK